MGLNVKHLSNTPLMHDRYAAVAAAPTPDREGRPEAASTATGAVGRRHKHKPQSYLDRGISI
jgi:hypothetical protein